MTTIRRIQFPSASDVDDGVHLLRFPFPVEACLTTRYAGEMGASGTEAAPARRSVLEWLQVDAGELISLRQVHSRTVYSVNNRATDFGRSGDGMITDRPELTLGVTVADCMPIYIADTRQGVLGLLHSGWRGTGIVAVALERMRVEYGSRAEDICVLLGPAIGACCYRVDEERAAGFAAEWGEDSVVRSSDGPHLDLLAANLGILRHAGVREVRYVAACTSCNPSLASFRRDGAENYTGMLALCGGLRQLDESAAAVSDVTTTSGVSAGSGAPAVSGVRKSERKKYLKLQELQTG